MHKKIYLNFLLYISLQFCVGLENSTKEYVSDSDWDYLVYSQRWPITGCAEWEEKDPHNTCNLPSDRSIWLVHGIWPNKIGKDGPFYCPSSIHFDPEQLDPIHDKMNARWTNIEANTKKDSFWDHEWSKHGTCASSLPQLNSIFNYFNKGLDWNSQYDIALILANGGIVPGERSYNVQDISDVISSSLIKLPQIFCQVDKKSKEVLISEIRLCFNKSLDLIDCLNDGPIHEQDEEMYLITDNINTNCDLHKPVKYYADLPMIFNKPILHNYHFYEEYDKKLMAHQMQNLFKFRMDLLTVLKTLKLLMWVTI